MPASREYGAGSIEQTASGRFRFALPRSVTGGRRKWSKPFATRHEAESALRVYLYDAARGRIEADPGEQTIADFGLEVLGERRLRCAANDLALFRRHIAETPLGARSVTRVERWHVTEHLQRLAATPKMVSVKGGGKRRARETLSPQTVRHVHAVLRLVFSAAVERQLVGRNPCIGAKLPKLERADGSEPWTYLSATELEQLFAAPIREQYLLIYKVAIFTGLREGEIWALRWEDLLLEGDRPTCFARRSYDGPTKGNQARAFPLLPAAAAALRRVRELAKDTQPSSLVFPGHHGRMHSKGYDAQWSASQRAIAGLREDIVFHSFRHTCASHLLMGTWGARWQLAEVSKYLGHKSVAVTQRYAHLSHDHLADLAAKTRG